MSEPLVLPENPTSADAHFCHATRDAARKGLEKTGIDADKPLGPDNKNRVLARFLEPVLDNLTDVIDELAARAQQAKAQYLGTQQDIDFDRAGLITTIGQIEALQDDMGAYLALVDESEELPDDEQRAFLAELVYAPIFLGSGYAVIGDEESPWVKTWGLYCRPINLGIHLASAAATHSEKAGALKSADRGTDVLVGLAVAAGVVLLAPKIFGALRKRK